MPGEIEPLVRKVTQDIIDRYADASGDRNAIHIDEEFAKTTQFGGTIAHGMLILAFVNELMTGFIGEKWLKEGSLKMKFRFPAKPRDMLTIAAQQRETNFKVEIRNQNKQLLATGTAKVR